MKKIANKNNFVLMFLYIILLKHTFIVILSSKAFPNKFPIKVKYLKLSFVCFKNGLIL